MIVDSHSGSRRQRWAGRQRPWIECVLLNFQAYGNRVHNQGDGDRLALMVEPIAGSRQGQDRQDLLRSNVCHRDRNDWDFTLRGGHGQGNDQGWGVHRDGSIIGIIASTPTILC